MNHTDRYRQTAHWLVEQMDNELLLFNTQTMSIVSLNSSSSVVWQCCDGKTGVDNIIANLVQMFPDDSEQIQQDVMDAILELTNLDLIVKND